MKLKVSAALEKKLPGMSRAARYQAIRIENGLCAICGKEPLASSRMGAACLAKQRERMRARTDAKRRNRSLSYSVEEAARR